MKKYIWLIISMSLLLLVSTGCAQKSQETSVRSEESFKTDLCTAPYEASILGYDIQVKFDENGAGTATYENHSVNFDYTLTNIDGDKATVTVTGTGISEIDGKSVDVELVDGGLKATYGGMSYVLKPAA